MGPEQITLAHAATQTKHCSERKGHAHGGEEGSERSGGRAARPAARFVKEAKSYSSEITVIKDGRGANAKSSVKLMTLGARHGDKVLIRDEEEEE